jgi:hypothetical protein
MFLNYFKLGILKLLHLIPGVDMSEKIKETEEDIAANKQAVVDRANAISTTMEANVKQREKEDKEGSKKEGGMLDGIKKLFNIDHKDRASAHIEQKNAQVSAFKGIPGAVGGGMASGMPALTDGVKDGIKEAAKVDTNAGPEALLKQFSAKEGGGVEKDVKRNELLLAKDVAFKDYTIATSKEQKAAAEAKIQDVNAKLQALDTPAAQPVNPAAPASKTAAPTVAADQAKKELEKQQQDKTAAEKKKVEEEAAKKKQEEDAAKKKQEEDKNKKPESAETLLAELNTKMATLLKYTFTVAHNTNETVSATRSLNGNLLKS